MLHQAANQGVEFKKFDSLTKTESIKSRLIKERGYFCGVCKLSTWNNQRI